MESRVYIREAPYVLVLTDFAYSPPKIKKITAVTQNHGDCQKSQPTPKITLFVVTVIP